MPRIHKEMLRRSRASRGFVTAAVLLVLGLAFVDLVRAESRTGDASEARRLARAERQAERLMNAGLPFAEKMLAEHGEFFPFGAVAVPDGPIRIVGTFADGERPPAERVLDTLIERLLNDADNAGYEGVAIFVGVRIRLENAVDEIEAVQVGIEHRDGYCVDVFFPIDPERPGRLGEPIASPRRGQMLPGCPEPEGAAGES